jgi:5-methyltetrahydrofolate--homocysteine methyltransferase
MGTMLQAQDPTLEDFEGYEGCNEVLNVTRPDIVEAVHRAYLEAGSDLIETNTFGSNLAALGEYDIAHRIAELSEAGARIARKVADEFSTPEKPRWVLGSVGPGTKLPTLGHTTYTAIRDGYRTQVAAMIKGGIDAVQVETSQDLLQTKAAILGAKLAIIESGQDIPVMASVTVETTGTMLLGSEIGAALTTLEPLGIDVIGLNCATGPAEMSEHLRYLSRHARCLVSAMPNAGLPELTADGARYPLSPEGLAGALDRYAADYGLAVLGGCCGTTPEHIRSLTAAVNARPVAARAIEHEPALSSLYPDVPLDQDTTYLSIGERTNANGSRAFRDAMLAENWDECIEIAKAQAREGAHLLDLCVDYVGRDGVADMAELAGRLATATTLPVVLDSTEPAVLRAGLEHLPGRAMINSVNFEDGDGPTSRYQRVMELVSEHGAAVVALCIDEEGQARTAEWKVRVASRLIEDLTTRWGLDIGDIVVDCLTFPIATGQEETRRDAIETIEAIRRLKALYPGVHTTLGVSNVSFGLNPASRQVLNSVFLHEAVEAGLDSAIVNQSKIVPLSKIPDEHREVALDLVYDRRTDSYDPLTKFLQLFDGVTTRSSASTRAAELAALPLTERLARRIIDGEAKGLGADLDEALTAKPALSIINDDLLAGMKTVGELFGSGQMQLPFVLQSAEVMKKAVAYLEPYMERADAAGKGTLVLATVKGDVHDIGKNLVDIIVSNNGYTVVNIGIKQPVTAIIEAAEEHHADAIGMSGLLVKSTVVMKENLLELNQRGLAGKYPVLLGGAALTRSFVEHDLNAVFDGEVRYAKDAFEGLRLMDAVMAVKRGVPGATLPAIRERRVKKLPGQGDPDAPAPVDTTRSDITHSVPGGVDVPTPPFWGSRVVKGLALNEVATWLDERATFLGQWGLKTGTNATYEQLLEMEGRPRLRMWLERIRTEQIAEFAVVYGYWPCYSDGNTVVVLDPESQGLDDEIARIDYPRQRRDKRLCIADFFRSREEAELYGPDVISFQLVTMGAAVSRKTAVLFDSDAYREYLELHGLSVQLTEALAEMWHDRVRHELGLAQVSTDTDAMIRDQAYRGSRYSFGYPACPSLEDRATLVRLLDPSRIGVELSEELQLHPEQSTDAFVVHHPEAKYFNAT